MCEKIHDILKGCIVVLLVVFADVSWSQIDFRRFERQVWQMLDSMPAEVGVVFASDKGDTLFINGDMQFPMFSVVKLPQALTVCQSLRNARMSLNEDVFVKKSELIRNTWSPMRESHPEGGHFAVAKLLRYSLVQSDNNAFDILSSRYAAMNEVEAYLHSLGIVDCSIRVDERTMMQDPSQCYQNWITPKAASQLLDFCYQTREAEAYSQFIWNALSQCTTGQDRIPKFINDKVSFIAHKTGTGFVDDRGWIAAVNDMGVIGLPDGHHYNLVVFVKDAACPQEQCEALIARVSHLCLEFYNGSEQKSH